MDVEVETGRIPRIEFAMSSTDGPFLSVTLLRRGPRFLSSEGPYSMCGWNILLGGFRPHRSRSVAIGIVYSRSAAQARRSVAVHKNHGRIRPWCAAAKPDYGTVGGKS
jgi:hypothetical protein